MCARLARLLTLHLRLVSMLVLAPLFAAVLVACPPPQGPKGPPPEYEEPPAPSWLAEAGADSGAAEPDGGATEAGPTP